MIAIDMEHDDYCDEVHIRAVDTAKLFGDIKRTIGQVDVKQNWLWSLEVRSDKRKQGIGERIVAKAMEYISKRKYPYAFLYCREDVREWYEKRGWVCVDETTYGHRGKEWIMMKQAKRARES